MPTPVVQQELSLIKQMIEKTRRDTALSGHFFIYMGLITLLGSLIIHLLESHAQTSWILPTVAIMALANAVMGYRAVKGANQGGQIKTYTQGLFWQLWRNLGLAALIFVFVFPALHLYPFGAVPSLVSMLMGVGLVITGVMLELSFLKWSGIAWWVGAGLMAILPAPYKLAVMLATLIFGWILPGMLLNRRIRRGAAS